jgi:hypothetical protein
MPARQGQSQWSLTPEIARFYNRRLFGARKRNTDRTDATDDHGSILITYRWSPLCNYSTK